MKSAATKTPPLHSRAWVVSPVGDLSGEASFGSLSLAHIGAFIGRVQALVENNRPEGVVVHLANVPRYGAAFIGALLKLNAWLEARGCWLAVSGDHLGLVEIMGLGAVVPVIELPSPDASRGGETALAAPTAATKSACINRIECQAQSPRKAPPRGELDDFIASSLSKH